MVLREWARDAHATAQAARAALRHVADDPASLTDEQWVALLGASGAELEQLCALADDTRRMGQLELYRSGDFSKLEQYEGRLGALGVPTLVLWGENDTFAPVAGAERFRDEIPGSELVVVEGAGHFVMDDEPERCAGAIAAFLSRL